MLVERVVRIWNLAHLRFSGDLLKGTHLVFGLVLQNKSNGSGGTGRYQLENQSTNCLRLMLPGSTRQSIRPFKAVQPFNSEFPILAGSRSGNRYTPLSTFVAKCVLDTRSNFSAYLSITEILQLDRHWHRIAILAEELPRPFVGANRSKPCGKGCRGDLWRVYPQFVLKTAKSTGAMSEGFTKVLSTESGQT